MGNPVDSAEVYAYMKSYAPYENVEAKDYPPMLVTAGLNDPRVSYWEPAKWVARLRATKTDDNRLLLKTEMGRATWGRRGATTPGGTRPSSTPSSSTPSGSPRLP